MVYVYVEEKVQIPEGCKVEVVNKKVTVTGPKGTVSKDFSHIFVFIDIHEENVRCRLWNCRKQERSKLITCSKLIKNMIDGSMSGYFYELKAAYKHFPITFEIKENGKLLIVKNFLGQKWAREFKMIGDTIIKQGVTKDHLILEGISKEDVSQTAGLIQNNCLPKNLDRRIFQDGVYIATKGLIEEVK
ncbi:60S ribosomal protein L9 [Spraguea lophii 42_110]|uniref:60S ribosomal protein L9 n=1 Tax=Spraguea lophii (strain 42_110) TaxID=1358809 RepID=S7XRZ9_SPRLO|nr:Chain LH0, 60S ribosomal protein L9 [Spraguea lophii 42_110]7QJH_KH0 Chain KH0, 60S ribosomal protein L9 [Spraguea lophii 42_110]7QJH_LH0 Chain LH0, 60S ribosomal protein L9 [Spraguea lophii 42_110]8BR3_LH0 Chain LH0, 60S ribosomal protein L9 [Spraguea lophii 42_110]8P5D_LH0 Chain LH0, 60S ribosomal protein L9 [Spraguea lophii 42_110]8P60_KH0 Chain KH0, 60S ribosomal protein L9 [Spraguea lophii 42_110]8P60_LH0 Chain LH0, 60S ribosomal protein L9 [Spraguea lophii 42_110]EPR78688.1 60S ribo